jgi:hypothetical protein
MNVRGAPTLGAAPVLALFGAGTRHVLAAARSHAYLDRLEEETPDADTCPCCSMGLESLEVMGIIYRDPRAAEVLHANTETLEEETQRVETCPCFPPALEYLELIGTPRGAAAKAAPCGVVRSPIGADAVSASVGRRTMRIFVLRALEEEP